MTDSRVAGWLLPDGTWAPTRSDDYDADCASGRQFADDLLAEMEATQNPSLFGGVIQAITVAGLYGGVEAGFCHRLSFHIIFG